MKTIPDQERIVEIVETQLVNGTPPTLTLTVSGQSIGLTGCVGWIGHVETGNSPPGYLTVTATNAQALQTLQELAESGTPFNGTFTVAWNGSTVCTLQFQSATVSTTPPLVPGHPVQAGAIQGQFTIVG